MEESNLLFLISVVLSLNCKFDTTTLTVSVVFPVFVSSTTIRLINHIYNYVLHHCTISVFNFIQ